MNEWRLSEEISRITHQWPVIVIFILVGSLLGGLIGYLLPSPYQASDVLYVGLDPYETIDDRYVNDFANFEFTNPDDYKNWQMSQLSLLVTSDSYLEETLVRLREQGTYWNEIDTQELKSMVAIFWRNAGRYRLVAKNMDPQLAEQAVITWRDVIIEKTNFAISKSRQLLQIGLQMKNNTRESGEASLQLAKLEEIKNGLFTWKKQILESGENRSVDELDRWRLLSLATQAAGYDPSWKELLGNFPPSNGTSEDYNLWIDKLMVSIDMKYQIVQTQVDKVNREGADLQAQWENSLLDGQGLSAAFVIKELSDQPPDIEKIRSTSTSALIGGVIGLLIWALIMLARISKRVVS